MCVNYGSEFRGDVHEHRRWDLIHPSLVPCVVPFAGHSANVYRRKRRGEYAHDGAKQWCMLASVDGKRPICRHVVLGSMRVVQDNQIGVVKKRIGVEKSTV